MTSLSPCASSSDSVGATTVVLPAPMIIYVHITYIHSVTITDIS
jgi:hypothetical protein